MSRGLRWGLCRLVSGVGPVGLYRRLRSSEPFSRLSRIAAFLAVALTFTSGATRTATSRRTEGRRSFGGASPTVPRLSTTGVALSLRTCPVAGGRVNPACTAWASCPTRLYGSGLVGRLAGGTRRTLHTHRWAGRHSDQLLCGVVAGRRLSTVSTPCHSNGVARHHHTTTQRTYCHGCSSYTPVDAARHGHHRGGRQTGGHCQHRWLPPLGRPLLPHSGHTQRLTALGGVVVPGSVLNGLQSRTQEWWWADHRSADGWGGCCGWWAVTEEGRQ